MTFSFRYTWPSSIFWFLCELFRSNQKSFRTVTMGIQYRNVRRRELTIMQRTLIGHLRRLIKNFKHNTTEVEKFLDEGQALINANVNGPEAGREDAIANAVADCIHDIKMTMADTYKGLKLYQLHYADVRDYEDHDHRIATALARIYPRTFNPTNQKMEIDGLASRSCRMLIRLVDIRNMALSVKARNRAISEGFIKIDAPPEIRAEDFSVEPFGIFLPCLANNIHKQFDELKMITEFNACIQIKQTTKDITSGVVQNPQGLHQLFENITTSVNVVIIVILNGMIRYHIEYDTMAKLFSPSTFERSMRRVNRLLGRKSSPEAITQVLHEIDGSCSDALFDLELSLTPFPEVEVQKAEECPHAFLRDLQYLKAKLDRFERLANDEKCVIRECATWFMKLYIQE